MRQVLTEPCNQCPFLNKMKRGFTMARLKELALSDFPCHKTCDEKENEEGLEEFIGNENSVYCAGAMIFLAKRKTQYSYGFDDTKLNMGALVR